MSHSDSEVRDKLRPLIVVRKTPFKAKCRHLTNVSALLKKHKYLWRVREIRLKEAVSTNNVENVKFLLKEGVNPNCADSHLRSVLHIAVSKGYSEIVKLLLIYGANPNKKDIMLNTPLHLAACSHNLTIVSYLIEAGADVNSPDIHGRHPLQLAKSKLQLLMKDWSDGVIEKTQLKLELKEIIKMMIAVENQKQSTNLSLNNLEFMKLSMSSDEENIEDQMTKLLAGLNDIQIA